MKVHAQHKQNISYTLSIKTYWRLLSDIDLLSAMVQRVSSGRMSFSVSFRPTSVDLKISGPFLRQLVHVKSEVEKILTGEVLCEDGRVVWDDYFTRHVGTSYFQDLQAKFPRVSIQKDSQRRLVG